MTKFELSHLLAVVLCVPLAAQSQSAGPCAALAGLKIEWKSPRPRSFPPEPLFPRRIRALPPSDLFPRTAASTASSISAKASTARSSESALPSRCRKSEAWNGDFMMQGGGGGNGFVAYPAGANYAGTNRRFRADSP